MNHVYKKGNTVIHCLFNARVGSILPSLSYIFFKCSLSLLCWYICILLAFDVHRMPGNVLWSNL